MARLTQIIEQSRLISLQKRLTSSLDMSVVFEEPNGSLLNVIGTRGGVCKACTEFIDIEGNGKNKCLYEDTLAAARAQGMLLGRKAGEVVVEFYVCNGKLRNFVIPISIGGEVLGNVFSGQFLVKALTKADRDYHDVINEMAKLGKTHDFVLSYASMPNISDIPQIARDNNIPADLQGQFDIAYKETFPAAKPLKYVINSVYLLSEIAQTISSVGNAYYYTNTCDKLLEILPDELKLALESSLEEIRLLVHKISNQASSDLSEHIMTANKLICEVLVIAERNYSEYIRSLLIPYESHLLPMTSIILLCQKKIVAAKARSLAKTLRAKLNRSLRYLAYNSDYVSAPDKSLLHEYDSELKKCEDTLLLGSEGTLEKCDKEDLQRTLDVVNEIKGKFIKIDASSVEEEPGLDEIEALVSLITDPDLGLQSVRNELCRERVLNDLPSDLRSLREALRLRYDLVYLNWGSISPSYDFMVKERELWAFEVDRNGPVSVHTGELIGSDTKRDVLNAAREAVSELVRCKPQEVILTGNTTSGILMSLLSVVLSPKGSREIDRIILTNRDYETAFYCVEFLEKKFSVKHEVIPVSDEPSAREMANQIISKSSDGRTKVVLLSHVTYNTGQRIDIREIITIVKRTLQDKSPLFLVDGAQAVGNIEVDVASLGCDFYAADAHKWLKGPTGSGFLCVRESYLDSHKENFILHENLRAEERFRPHNPLTKKPYEPATMNIDIYVGMTRAIRTLLEIRRHCNLEERVEKLSTRFRAMAKAELGIFDIQLVERNSVPGICSIRFLGMQDSSFYDGISKELEEKYHVVLRAISSPPSLRACLSCFNSEWEVTYFVKALGKVLEVIPFFASRLARSKESEDLHALRDEAIRRVHKSIEVATETVQNRQKEATIRFSYDFSKVKEGQDIAGEMMEKLNKMKTEVIERMKNAPSKAELVRIEKEIDEKTRTILR